MSEPVKGTARSDQPVLASISFRLTSGDFAAAQRKYMRWSFSRPRNYIASIIVILVAVVVGLTLASPSTTAALVVGVAAGAGAAAAILVGLRLAQYAVLPLFARRAFRQQPSLAHHYRVDLIEAGVYVGAPDMDGFVGWANYVAWSQDTRVILLWQSDRLFQIIPARAADPAFIDAFHRLVAAVPRR